MMIKRTILMKNPTIKNDNEIRKSYLFIKDGSMDRLFQKIDLKSSTPMIPEYKEYIIIVEKGMQTKALAIPNAKQEHSGCFQDIKGVSDYLSRFDSQIAEKIKKDFIPLFDPLKEDICEEIYKINENLYLTGSLFI